MHPVVRNHHLQRLTQPHARWMRLSAELWVNGLQCRHTSGSMLPAGSLQALRAAVQKGPTQEVPQEVGLSAGALGCGLAPWECSTAGALFAEEQATLTSAEGVAPRTQV